MLTESDDKFSRAMMLYVRESVGEEYVSLFETVCDYERLEKQLDGSSYPDFVYQKKDGMKLRLQILRFLC